MAPLYQILFMNQTTHQEENENTKPGNEKRKTNVQLSREILGANIEVEIDLESRRLIFKKTQLPAPHLLHEGFTVDTFIKKFVHPGDSEQVLASLTEAGRGIEKPIAFIFINPENRQCFWFEYHYEIVYVRYSQTRLRGRLKSAGRHKNKH